MFSHSCLNWFKDLAHFTSTYSKVEGQCSRFRRRSVSRDVCGQAGAGALSRCRNVR
ncbi:protein of unknown function [Pseudorhizobium banfieldiae]|uniref:Uncharacterized protein n=1 Tax=Pseudorhizobium banfieldiae TaxID=1125847 RepID=L0NK53_9HYPH|nr:protein of unknown function [Pseudorhizobium banfieldiae]